MAGQNTSSKSLLVGILTILTYGSIAEAQIIGLSPSTKAKAQAEAVVSSVYGTDSLFYNPANLAWNSFHLRLFGIEGAADPEAIETANEFKGFSYVSSPYK